MTVTVLGSGTSHGIPVIGCPCEVCASSDPRDTRFRSALYVQGKNGESVVIDTGPEFRLQALRAGITQLDAVLLTHTHADHLHGLDDLRPLCREHYLPVYGNESTIAELRERFSYIFQKTQYDGSVKPLLNPVVVLAPLSAPLQIGGLTFTPVPAKHGTLDVLGWLISESVDEQPVFHGAVFHGAVSHALYLTDTSELPAASRDLIHSATSGAARGAIRGAVRVCIIGALRRLPHPTHFSFEQAIDAALALGAERVYLTHICHDHSHSEIEAYCQELGRHIGPAWDMLSVKV
jgi:phosphoribosyl 1,2-cyclic phosphate phosphodiesterase